MWSIGMGRACKARTRIAIPYVPDAISGKWAEKWNQRLRGSRGFPTGACSAFRFINGHLWLWLEAVGRDAHNSTHMLASYVMDITQQIAAWSFIAVWKAQRAANFRLVTVS